MLASITIQPTYALYLSILSYIMTSYNILPCYIHVRCPYIISNSLTLFNVKWTKKANQNLAIVTVPLLTTSILKMISPYRSDEGQGVLLRWFHDVFWRLSGWVGNNNVGPTGLKNPWLIFVCWLLWSCLKPTFLVGKYMELPFKVICLLNLWDTVQLLQHVNGQSTFFFGTIGGFLVLCVHVGLLEGRNPTMPVWWSIINLGRIHWRNRFHDVSLMFSWCFLNALITLSSFSNWILTSLSVFIGSP